MTFRRLLLSAALIGCILGLGWLSVTSTLLAPPSHARAVARALPSVVSITTTRSSALAGNPLLADPSLREVLEPDPDTGAVRGLGSGVILDARGFVVTNDHVVRDTQAIEVVLADGRVAPAALVGSDPETDLALLRVNADNLVPARLGDPDALRVGDIVLAIGNPLGFMQTVTQGILSATGRDRVGITTFENFLQTDAAINPGNSGGALVNGHGEVIGINAAIATGSGGSQGIGLAIPIDAVRTVVEALLRDGRVTRGWLGVSATASPEGGIVVGDVAADGPAAQAGLRRGDRITHIGGEPVRDARAARTLIAGLMPEAEVELAMMRDGQRQVRRVMVSARPGRGAP